MHASEREQRDFNKQPSAVFPDENENDEKKVDENIHLLKKRRRKKNQSDDVATAGTDETAISLCTSKPGISTITACLKMKSYLIELIF